MGHWWIGQGSHGKGHGWWAKVHNYFFWLVFNDMTALQHFQAPQDKKTHLWRIRLMNIWKIGQVQFHRTWQDVACMLRELAGVLVKPSSTIFKRMWWLGLEKSKCHPHLQEGQEGGSAELQDSQPHFSTSEGDAENPPGNISKHMMVRKVIGIFVMDLQRRNNILPTS